MSKITLETVLIERKNRVALRLEALKREQEELTKELGGLNTVVSVWKNRSYDPIVEEAKATEKLSQPVVKIPKRVKYMNLESSKAVLKHTMGLQSGAVTSKELSRLTGWSTAKTSRIIASAVTTGEIFKYPNGRTIRYLVK